MTSSIDGVTEYTYDELGQLVTETVDGETVNAMVYDNYGNIVSKNGVAYTYGDDTWKDLLTGYGKQTITYDAQGNPTSYLGHTLTWEKGRQLKTFDNVRYTYNFNDVRTAKVVGDTIHHYTVDGTKILSETWAESTLIPLYDYEDAVCGIIYNDEPFYFQKNIHGDIVGIIDKNTDVVAKYSYDAWGFCSVILDCSNCSIATINPYRYRGYYYDVETELYYLQCRYFDSKTGRFINSDEGLILTLSKYPNRGNLFAYCHNDPINEVDYFGYLSFWKRAYYLAHGVFLITTGLLSIIAAIKKGFIAAALGSFTANLLGGLIGTALGLMPLGQYWGTIIAVTMIISILWQLKSMLYNIPAGLAEIKKALS